MGRIEHGVNIVEDYTQKEVSQRGPAIVKDFKQQSQETKGDLINLYRTFKDKYCPAINSWVADHFGAKKPPE